MQLGDFYLSPKSITVIVDAVVSAVILLATRFLSPADADLVVKLVGILQVAVVALFVGQTAVEIKESEQAHELALYGVLDTDDETEDDNETA